MKFRQVKIMTTPSFQYVQEKVAVTEKDSKSATAVAALRRMSCGIELWILASPSRPSPATDERNKALSSRSNPYQIPCVSVERFKKCFVNRCLFDLK